jgi:EmrB/QacA subfamily drug resistance transporter
VPNKWWVLVAIGVGTFMSALDGSVVNVVLPVVARAFAADLATVEWVVTVYLLVVSGLLLSFGRLGDLRGHKRLYLVGFGLFFLGSVSCGLARSAGMLILFRGLQALGAAMLFANSPAILTKSFSLAERGRALGLQATMTYLGLTVGPSLGGFLAERFSWRAVFYINVPIVLAALALSWRFIPADSRRSDDERFDPAGAVLFTAGLVMLLFALNQGATWGWGSPWILALIAASLVVLAAFVLVERRSASPMLDLRLFRSQAFSAATASATLNYVCVYSLLFLMPFYLEQGRGLSAAEAGRLLTAQPIIMAIVAPLSGTLSDRMPAWVPSTLGMLILSIGAWLLSALGPSASMLQVAVGLGVAGLGIGLFVSPNSNALMSSAPRSRQGISAGILATARNVGMVLGVGLAGAIFSTVLARSAAAGVAQPLFPAIAAAFRAAAVVALLGGLTSAVRGRPQPANGAAAPN